MLMIKPGKKTTIIKLIHWKNLHWSTKEVSNASNAKPYSKEYPVEILSNEELEEIFNWLMNSVSTNGSKRTDFKQ